MSALINSFNMKALWHKSGDVRSTHDTITDDALWIGKKNLREFRSTALQEASTAAGITVTRHDTTVRPDTYNGWLVTCVMFPLEKKYNQNSQNLYEVKLTE